MTTGPEAPQLAESYFTWRAFRLAQNAGWTAIRYDLEQLNDMNDFLAGETGRSLAVGVQHLDFTYSDASRKLPPWDVNFADSPARYGFIPVDQLNYQPDSPLHPTPRGQLPRPNRFMLQLQIKDFFKPNLPARLAYAITEPTPGIAHATGHAEAWDDQIKRAGSLRMFVDALTVGLTSKRESDAKQAPLDEAAKRFAGAVVLERRR